MTRSVPVRRAEALAPSTVETLAVNEGRGACEAGALSAVGAATNVPAATPPTVTPMVMAKTNAP
jgi:hypothetical protein